MFGRSRGGFNRRHHLAAAHDRDAIGDRHDLLELMGDEDDGLALGLQLLEDAEQVFGLVRRQDTSRLIENEHFGAAIECLQNLDALLKTNRQVIDHGVGIDLEAIILFQPFEFAARLGEPAIENETAFRTQHDILEHGEFADQHEMLMHHADPGPDGVGGTRNMRLLAVDADLTRIGLIKAEQDRHQGGFAGPVFADDAMDGALFYLERDILVGVDRTKALVDMGKRDGGRDRHRLCGCHGRSQISKGRQNPPYSRAPEWFPP